MFCRVWGSGISAWNLASNLIVCLGWIEESNLRFKEEISKDPFDTMIPDSYGGSHKGILLTVFLYPTGDPNTAVSWGMPRH